jgi:hypothetical protein
VIWIPRPLYESLPYASVVLGISCLVAPFMLERGPSGLLLTLGGMFVTLGLVLWMKRREFRTTRHDYDPRALDE